MDGFDEDEATSEADESRVGLRRFLAAECDTLEPLELADELLDPGAALVEQLGEESRPVDRVGLARDDRADAALAGGLPVSRGVVAFVGQRGARHDIGADVEQDLELAAVTGLAAREVDGKRLAVVVALAVDLGRDAAARAAERLVVLPALAPAAETCARTVVLSNLCTRCAVGLSSASA